MPVFSFLVTGKMYLYYIPLIEVIMRRVIPHVREHVVLWAQTRLLARSHRKKYCFIREFGQLSGQCGRARYCLRSPGPGVLPWVPGFSAKSQRAILRARASSSSNRKQSRRCPKRLSRSFYVYRLDYILTYDRNRNQVPGYITCLLSVAHSRGSNRKQARGVHT